MTQSNRHVIITLLPVLIAAFADVSTASSGPKPVMSLEFKVDARQNATKSPLATGINVSMGQHIVFEPNPQDKWHTGKGDFVDYRGRSGPPFMRLHYKIGETAGRISNDQTVVKVDRDGPLSLYCQDKWPGNNNGYVRVKVSLFIRPPGIKSGDRPSKPDGSERDMAEPQEEDPVDKIMARLATAKGRHESDILGAKTVLLAAFDEVIAKHAASGDLDKIKPLHEQRKAFEDHQTLPKSKEMFSAMPPQQNLWVSCGWGRWPSW